ncbi:MAG TPA: hypothetical protein VEI97_11050, partial [bacterium]|nr:hypothetical protein [bacterium]
MREADKSVTVAAAYHPKGCCVCRVRLVEKHRLRLAKWGGKYEYGNVVLLCPTHHKLVHVLIFWQYTQRTGGWRPWEKRG